MRSEGSSSHLQHPEFRLTATESQFAVVDGARISFGSRSNFSQPPFPLTRAAAHYWKMLVVARYRPECTSIWCLDSHTGTECLIMFASPTLLGSARKPHHLPTRTKGEVPWSDYRSASSHRSTYVITLRSVACQSSSHVDLALGMHFSY
jgi:hypothetical protein